eukprot:767502-Hanusia_phi.AAC.4
MKGTGKEEEEEEVVVVAEMNMAVDAERQMARLMNKMSNCPSAHHLTSVYVTCNSKSAILLEVQLPRPPTPNKLELSLLDEASGLQVDNVGVTLWTDDKEVEGEVVRFLSERDLVEKDNLRVRENARRAVCLEICSRHTHEQDSSVPAADAVRSANQEIIESFGFSYAELCDLNMTTELVLMKVRGLLNTHELVLLFSSIYLLVPDFLNTLRTSLSQNAVPETCSSEHRDVLLSSFVSQPSDLGEFLIFVRSDSSAYSYFEPKRCISLSLLSHLSESFAASSRSSTFTGAILSAVDSISFSNECQKAGTVMLGGLRQGDAASANASTGLLDVRRTLSRLCCDLGRERDRISACSNPSTALAGPQSEADGSPEEMEVFGFHLSVLVPVRDRDESLVKLAEGLAALLLPRVPYTLWAIEQRDGRPFNRGALLNVGYLLAEAAGSELFVLQDVDYIPLPSALPLYVEPPLAGPR